MDGERVDLRDYETVRRVWRWHHSPGDPHRQQWVTVGELPDRRWFVDHVRQVYEPARAYPDEPAALAHARTLMGDGGPWVEVPAAYTARQEPATPGPWERIGTEWRRPG